MSWRSDLEENYWGAVLVGGPWDGDSGLVHEPAERYLVWFCSQHKTTHWAKPGEQGVPKRCESYRRDEVDDKQRTAKYVYEDLTGGGGRRIAEEVEAPPPRERELQPA